MNKETGCVTPRKLPCLEGAFGGGWFGLSQAAVKAATRNMTQRAEQMRAGFWIVRAPRPAAVTA